MRIALLHSRIRVEEQMLIDDLQSRGARVDLIDLRTVVFDLADPTEWAGYDIVVDRSLSLTSSMNTVRILESFGVRCVNPAATIEACSDKLRTTLALQQAGVPVPRTCVALTPESALEAVERIGYPAVIKPTVGSWGRLIARVNDRDAAEAVLEHRVTLGSPQHALAYIQEYINKPQRDLRIFVINGEPVAGIVRIGDHWVTNTARGARTENLVLTDELRDLAIRAAAAVRGDFVAIDILECPRRGALVNEINHSMEFRNSVAVTGVDIPARMIDHIESLAATPNEEPQLAGAAS